MSKCKYVKICVDGSEKNYRKTKRWCNEICVWVFFFGWDDKNADNLGHTYNYIHIKIFDVITHPWTNPR